MPTFNALKRLARTPKHHLVDPSLAAPRWGRQRLLAVVVTMFLVIVSGLVGLVYAVHGAVASSGTSDDGAAVAVHALPSGQARRDAIAATSMLRVTPQDSRGGIPAASPAPTIVVPAATS